VVARSLALLVAAGLCVAHNAWIWPWTLDDAYIYMRYAQNLAAGHGPVFNPGERCEGYSSFFWVALLALGRLCGGDLVALAKSYGAVAVPSCLVLVHQSWRFVPALGKGGAALACLFLGSCAAFTPWAMGGMETPVLAFELTLLVLGYVALRRRGAPGSFALGLLGAVAAMTRPEGFMVFGLVALDSVVRALRARSWRSTALLLGGFALMFGPFYLWRYAYYGHPLPNTFYAKVGNTAEQYLRGLYYCAEYLLPGALLLAPVKFAVLSGRLARQHPDLRGLPVLLACYAGYVVYVGGDFMPAFRFFAPVTPLLCVLAVLGLRLLPWPHVRHAAFVLVPLWGIAASELSPRINAFLKADEVARVGCAVGRWFREHAAPDAVIAVNAAGAIPFCSGLRAIDMLGLNDVHIAHRAVPDMGKGWAGHEKGDGAYVLARRPDYILFHSVAGNLDPKYLTDRELHAMPEFHERYRPAAYAIETGTWVKAFVVYELRK
jgi:hypothetical protein